MSNFLESETQIKLYQEINRKVENIKEQLNQNRSENVKEYLSNIKDILDSEIKKFQNLDSVNFIKQLKDYVYETTSIQEKYAYLLVKMNQ